MSSTGGDEVRRRRNDWFSRSDVLPRKSQALEEPPEVQEAQGVRYCPNYGNALPYAPMNFCPNCGQALETSATAEIPTGPQPIPQPALIQTPYVPNVPPQPVRSDVGVWSGVKIGCGLFIVLPLLLLLAGCSVILLLGGGGGGG